MDVNIIEPTQAYTVYIRSSSDKFKHSVSSSQSTHCISITKTNGFILLKEIITVYSENAIKLIHILFGQNATLLCVKARPASGGEQ
jgi:hypothetical protein